MKVIYVDINIINEYKDNPRLNEKGIDAVANSIKDFGFKVPIVIDGDNEIVCGHTRYLAAKSLGLDKIPCIKADDLTEEQIKAFRIVDNKVAEIATWNSDKLEKELSLGVDKLERYGFNEYELESYGANVDVKNFYIDELKEKRESESEKHICPFCGEEF